ncbi:hypothetical protein PSTT_14686 [Puccinia striiformis]|uniref:Uncharacterized protein n=1 Tax=Puccinia striiformis TaxID=27350 RepID=A0A2S4UL64_9BASI|nr:hypothetical protein PSTT_14686 [Puccinia striiformis]
MAEPVSAVPRRSFQKNRSTASTTHDPNQTSTVSRKPPSKKVRSLATKSLPIHDGHLPPKPNLRRHLPLNSNLRRPGAVKVAKTTSCKKDQFRNSSHPSRPLGSSNDQERKIAQIVGETDSGNIGSDLSKRHMSESSTNIQVTHKPPVLTQPPSSLKPSQTHPTQAPVELIVTQFARTASFTGAIQYNLSPTAVQSSNKSFSTAFKSSTRAPKLQRSFQAGTGTSAKQHDTRRMLNPI